MLMEDVKANFRHAVASGRISHAYLVSGPPAGAAADFAVFAQQLLACRAPDAPCGVCDTCRQIASRIWCDAFWLYPAKKSRIISVQQMRRGPPESQNPFPEPYFLPWLGESSLAGGWKFGVVVYADRMQAEAANALLKTLEEPPPETMLLLLTDAPQLLLPTIRSRCAALSLTTSPPELAEEYFAPLMEALSETNVGGPLAASAIAARIQAILDAMKAEAERTVKADLADDPAIDADDDLVDAQVSALYREKRSLLLQTLLRWTRDLLVLRAGGDGIHYDAFRETLSRRAARLTLAEALANVDAVEELARQLERSIPESTSLPYWLDRLSLGVEKP